MTRLPRWSLVAVGLLLVMPVGASAAGGPPAVAQVATDGTIAGLLGIGAIIGMLVLRLGRRTR